MKTLLCIVGLGLVACGRPAETLQDVGIVEPNRITLTENDFTLAEAASRAVDAACPLAFPSAGLCAAVDWVKAPVADAPVEAKLRFWKKGQGDAATGPFVEPTSKPKAFFIMKCCRTPTGCPLSKSSDGVYASAAVKLLPGEFWLFVQVGSEKASADVSVR